MREVAYLKAIQCPEFAAALTDSGEKVLVENTKDPFWGKGPNGEGHNMFGKILMDLRREMPKFRDSELNYPD